MDRVKVVILPGKGEKLIKGDPKTAFGLDLRLVHPETGEDLHCRDVHLAFPIEGVVTATAEFIVSEVVVQETEEV